MKNNIEPTYCTFEQSVLLKEKRFDVELKTVYNLKSESAESHYPIMKNSDIEHGTICTRPEQWQVIEWLRVNHNIELSAQVNFYNKKAKLGYFYTIDKFDSNDIHDGKDYNEEQMNLIGDKKGFNTPQQAISAAIDYILKELLK